MPESPSAPTAQRSSEKPERGTGTFFELAAYANESTEAPKGSKSDNASFSLFNVILVSGRKYENVESGPSTADDGKRKIFHDASAIEYPESATLWQDGFRSEKYSSEASSSVLGKISET